MNLLKVICIGICLFGVGELWSQEYNYDPNYESDILRFSDNKFAGTARFIGVGGAFSSVGADMSNFSYNPAGVGMYRSTVAQFTMGAGYSKFNSTYLSSSNSDTKAIASVPSLGLVFANTKGSKNGLFRNVSFGVAMNRLGEYNYREKVSALNTNPGSSLSWNWANEMSDVYNGNFTNETSVNEVSFNT